MATISTQSMRPPTGAAAAVRPVLLCMTFVFLAFPLVITAILTPKFEAIFKDFGVALPLLARVFINLGRMLASPIGCAAAIMAIGIVVAVTALLNTQFRRVTGIVFTLSALFAFAYIGLLIVSMFFPLTTMIESLKQGTP